MPNPTTATATATTTSCTTATVTRRDDEGDADRDEEEDEHAQQAKSSSSTKTTNCNSLLHTHTRSHYYTMRTARIYFHAYTYTICKHLLLFLTGRGRSANFWCDVVVVAALLQFYDTTTTCIQYAHTHMHARDNMCARTDVNFILYFTQFALPLWKHTHTYTYVFSVTSLIVLLLPQLMLLLLPLLLFLKLHSALRFLCVISLSTPRCVCLLLVFTLLLSIPLFVYCACLFFGKNYARRTGQTHNTRKN